MAVKHYAGHITKLLREPRSTLRLKILPAPCSFARDGETNTMANPAVVRVNRPVTIPRLAWGITYCDHITGACIFPDVVPGGIAVEAGVRAGDRLLAINDVAVAHDNAHQVATEFSRDTIVLKLVRRADWIARPLMLSIERALHASVAHTGCLCGQLKLQI